MIYPMSRNKKNPDMLNGTSSYYSEEYAKRMCNYYLKDEFQKDSKGRIQRYFRLHVDKPHNIEMALAYEVYCPVCGKHLKQIGRCNNSHELGLYQCPICSK